jgi:hypothetical protein
LLFFKDFLYFQNFLNESLRQLDKSYNDNNNGGGGGGGGGGSLEKLFHQSATAGCRPIGLAEAASAQLKK